MTGITCDQIRAVCLDPDASPADLARRPDVAAHVNACVDCQDWMSEFAAGARAWAGWPAEAFTDQVLARTSGLDAVVRDLPLLADLDPGAGFAERVLLATSHRPAPTGWRARAAAAWWAVVRRPRFAWEAAYVVTVCWVLLFGNPVSAIDWSAANISTVAKERLAPPVRELRADLDELRARLAPEPQARGAAAASPSASGGAPAEAPAAVRIGKPPSSGCAAPRRQSSRPSSGPGTPWRPCLVPGPAIPGPRRNLRTARRVPVSEERNR